jgi:uncharacterized glyoxalase superfamily protein PhnB
LRAGRVAVYVDDHVGHNMAHRVVLIGCSQAFDVGLKGLGASSYGAAQVQHAVFTEQGAPPSRVACVEQVAVAGDELVDLFVVLDSTEHHDPLDLVPVEKRASDTTCTARLGLARSFHHQGRQQSGRERFGPSVRVTVAGFKSGPALVDVVPVAAGPLDQEVDPFAKTPTSFGNRVIDSGWRGWVTVSGEGRGGSSCDDGGVGVALVPRLAAGLAQHLHGRMGGRAGSQVLTRRGPAQLRIVSRMTTTPPGPARTGTAVIPVLVYEDIQAAHDFLVEAFGFTSGGVHQSDEGIVVHAEVRLGDAPVWLHRVAAEHELASPRGTPVSHGGLTVLVDDVDDHYAHSQASGAHIDHAPVDQDYGLREYAARDPENHRWWFSTAIAR